MMIVSSGDSENSIKERDKIRRYKDDYKVNRYGNDK